MAISSPLLETSINGAHGVLINMVGSADIGLEEVEQAASLVQAAVHPDANTIFGAAFDETMDDEISVTVIATGFEDQKAPGKPKTVSEMQHAEHFAEVAKATGAAAEPVTAAVPAASVPVPPAPAAAAPVQPVPAQPAPAVPAAGYAPAPGAAGDMLDDFKTIFSTGASAAAAPAQPAPAQPAPSPAPPVQPAPPAEPEEKDPFEDIFKIFNR